VQLGKTEEAAGAYGRALKLGLEGERSLEELAATITPGRAVRHGQHGYLHAALARIDARAGRTLAAIAGFRMAIAAGERRPDVLRDLARLLTPRRPRPRPKRRARTQKKAAPAKR
jgi:hypothetical protein